MANCKDPVVHGHQHHHWLHASLVRFVRNAHCNLGFCHPRRNHMCGHGAKSSCAESADLSITDNLLLCANS